MSLSTVHTCMNDILVQLGGPLCMVHDKFLEMENNDLINIWKMEV